MLRHYTNLRYDDWDLQLPLAEFAHNNAPSSATGMSPFFVCYGKHPLTPMSAVMETARKDWLSEPHENRQFAAADDFIADKQDIVRKAQAALESARQRMRRQEDPKRKPLTFQIGDQVSLKTKHLGIRTLPSKKLFQLWMGPFTVTKVINPAAYQIALPTFWRAHNVFHVSLLKPYIDNGEAADPQSFTFVGGKDNEFEVESILDFEPKTAHKDGKFRKANELIFSIKWKGMPLGHHLKQPYPHVSGTASDALRDLARRHNLPDDIFLKGSNRIPPLC